MKNKSAAVSEKEKEQKLKALRRDLEEKLEEQLPEELLEPKIRVEVEKVDVNEKLEPAKAKRVIEALLFASSKPMTVQEIKKVMRSASAREIQDVIEELRQEYQESGRSFEILEVAGGFEIATRKEYAPWICRADMQKKAKQATQSALETLAILAYKQPLTRAEIEELRGVDVSGHEPPCRFILTVPRGALLAHHDSGDTFDIGRDPHLHAGRSNGPHGRYESDRVAFGL